MSVIEPLFGSESIDLGTFGPVFSVEEDNMIAALKRKLQLLEEDWKTRGVKRTSGNKKLKKGLSDHKLLPAFQLQLKQGLFIMIQP